MRSCDTCPRVALSLFAEDRHRFLAPRGPRPPPLTLGRYAHVQLIDQTRALDALPVIQASRANVAALAATGT